MCYKFIWFSLPSPLEAEQVAAVAQERENLIVAHGNMFEVWGDEKSASFSREIRVCFAWEDEHKLTTGIVSNPAFPHLPISLPRKVFLCFEYHSCKIMLTLVDIGKVGEGYRVYVAEWWYSRIRRESRFGIILLKRLVQLIRAIAI